METEQRLNIVQRLAGIRKMAAAVKKSASGYNYTYSPEDEILANVTAGMNKYGVGLHLSVDPNFTITPFDYEKTKRGKNGEILTEKVNEWLFSGVIYFTWINEDDPMDTLSGTWPLVGQQADASQAFGAATTYCNRYFMLKYFQSATTKDDPDNYRSKQKAAEERENIEITKAIVNSLHAVITEFLEANPDGREAISKIIPKYVKVNGKASKDYFKLTDPDAASALQTEVLNYIEAYNTKAKEKKA